MNFKYKGVIYIDNLKYLIEYEDVMSRANFMWDMLRGIGWFLVEFLKKIVDSADMLLNEAYKLISFNQFAIIDKLMNKTEFKMLITVLFSISILYIGYCFLIKTEKPKGLLENVFLSIAVLCCISSGMAQLNNLTIASIKFLKPTYKTTSNEVVKSSITDLKWVDQNNFDGTRGNNFSPDKIDYIDPNEVMSKDNGINNSDILLQEVVTDLNGDLTTQSIETNILGFDTTSYYYRYYIDFFSIFISLVAVAIVIFVSVFKTAKLVFELAINGVLAMFFTANIYDNKKLKMILQNIFSSYIIIILCVVMVKFFMLANEFLVQNISNIFARAIILLFFSLATIDGPNIVERIFGIDVGLASGFRSIMSLWATSKAIGTIGKGAIGIGSGAVKLATDKERLPKVKNAVSGGIKTAKETGKDLGRDIAKNGGIKNGGITGTFNEKVNDFKDGIKENKENKQEEKRQNEINKAMDKELNKQKFNRFMNGEVSGINLDAEPTYEHLDSNNWDSSNNISDDSGNIIDSKGEVSEVKKDLTMSDTNSLDHNNWDNSSSISDGSGNIINKSGEVLKDFNSNQQESINLNDNNSNIKDTINNGAINSDKSINSTLNNKAPLDNNKIIKEPKKEIKMEDLLNDDMWE